MRKILSKSSPLALPLTIGALYILYLYLADRFIICADTCSVFRKAQELAYDGTFPLTGNQPIGNFSLGPLTECLTAIPIWITGRIESVYAFLGLLYLISIPVFYVAAKRWLNDDLGTFAATTWFAFFPIFITDLITPWNTSYLALFLAIYTFMLLRYPKGGQLLLLYGVVALCMQGELTCVTLIPASIVFLSTNRTDPRRNLHWHLAGMVVIVLLHLPVVLYYLKVPAPVISSLIEIRHVALKFDWGRLISGATYPLFFGFPGVILLAFLQKRPRATAVYLPRGKRLTLWVILILVVIIAGIEVRFSRFAPHHFYPLLPFLSLYTGFLAQRFVIYARHGIKLSTTIAITGLLITPFAIWFHLFISLQNLGYFANKLSYNEWLADETFSWMRRNTWQGSTKILHMRFGKNGDEGIPYLIKPVTDNCIDTMIRFRHRDEFRRREEGDQLAVISIARPKLLIGDLKSWLQTVPGVIPPNCETLSGYGDISSLMCPVSRAR